MTGRGDPTEAPACCRGHPYAILSRFCGAYHLAERCWSGRTGLPAKQLHEPKLVSRVRIPPSPPTHPILPWAPEALGPRLLRRLDLVVGEDLRAAALEPLARQGHLLARVRDEG